MKNNIIISYIQTTVGAVPVVSTRLGYKDKLGAAMVRWSINRDNYKVDAGLYAVGSPNAESNVFVTANYKLSFDHLRKNLDGLNAWILVLDTKGINVWCAAGKGTFGTKELVNRIKLTKLAAIVNHRRLILPQLGAVGVSAHEVKQESGFEIPSHAEVKEGLALNQSGFSFSATNLKISKGFTVVYGPVKASDIKSFINNNYKATKEMRKVTFGLTERLKLIPVDFVYGKYKLLIAFALFFVLAGIGKWGISLHKAVETGWLYILNILLAYIAGIVITPILLPFIPVRSFAFKGFISGVVMFGILLIFNTLGSGVFEIVSWFLIISGVSSFLAMNFTGSSTYTSLSGVKKEMKIAIPLQIVSAATGLVLFVIGRFL